jgi:uncharacterized protein (TIGR02996 family)
MMTDTEAALLRAICEQPDEDTPRLVFADWLTEQGGAVNTAWANGIRAQVALARGLPAQQPLVFESGYGQEKVRERLGLPVGLVGTWERGFPTSAAGHFRELREVWPRLAFRVPIRKLSIFEVSKEGAAEFVTWPALSLLNELDFSAVWEVQEPPDVIPALADCADLRGLKVLKLWYGAINDAAVMVLLDSPHLAGLGALRLDVDSGTPALSRAMKDRLVARFGKEAFDDSIPF